MKTTMALSRVSVLRLLKEGECHAFLCNEGQKTEALNRLLQAEMRKLRMDGSTAKFSCETGRIVFSRSDTLVGVVVVTRTA